MELIDRFRKFAREEMFYVFKNSNANEFNGGLNWGNLDADIRFAYDLKKIADNYVKCHIDILKALVLLLDEYCDKETLLPKHIPPNSISEIHDDDYLIGYHNAMIGIINRLIDFVNYPYHEGRGILEQFL